jgi:hypothetical protein
VHYILVGTEPKQEGDLLVWSEWMSSNNTRVGYTEIRQGVMVSTVFLGIDHQFGEGPPVVFETMIFGGRHDGYQDRYATWDRAIEGHKLAVDIARA